MAWSVELTDAGVAFIAEKLGSASPAALAAEVAAADAATAGGGRGDGCGDRSGGAPPALEELRLAFCDKITDVGVKAIAAGCPSLVTLDLDMCHAVTDEGIKAVAAECPRLARLHLSGCFQVGDAGVTAVVERARSRGRGPVQGGGGNGDGGTAGQEGGEGSGRGGILELDLTLCEVTDVGATAIAACCPYIERLTLARCDQVTTREEEKGRGRTDRGGVCVWTCVCVYVCVCVCGRLVLLHLSCAY